MNDEVADKTRNILEYLAATALTAARVLEQVTVQRKPPASERRLLVMQKAAEE